MVRSNRFRRPWGHGGVVAVLLAAAMVVAGCGPSLISGAPSIATADVPSDGSTASAGPSTVGSVIPPVPATGGSGGTSGTVPTAADTTAATPQDGSPTAASNPDGAPDGPRTDPDLPDVPAGTGGAAPAGTPSAVPATSDGTGSDGSSGLPSWVVPGARITYDVLGAQLSLNQVWVEDPNGDWVDPATGKHYSEQVSGNPNGGRNGMAGEGYDQYDIVGVSANQIAYTHTTYLSEQGSLVAASVTAGHQTDGNLANVFLNPALLTQMMAHPQQGYLVLTGPFQVGQVTFQAVSFVDTAGASPSTNVFDRKTGLLLQSMSDTQTTDQTQSSLSYVSLANARQVDLPGLTGENPSWVGSSGTLTFTGTLTSPIGTQSQTVPVTVDVSYQHLQGQIMQVTESVTSNGHKSGSQTQLAGPGGPYWLDPSALAGLTAGKVLDSDPLTGAKVTVAADASGQVTISSDDPGATTTARYDTGTGRLEQFQTQQGSTTLSVTAQGS